MLGTFHHHGLMRKYIAVFGTLFNDISIKRVDSSGNVSQTIKVPLSYGPKQKFLSRTVQDPSLTNSTAITLPRMAFEMPSLSYDSERKLNSLNKTIATYNGNLGVMYGPVPYILTFNLYIICKSAYDGTQILEQILPAFKPDFTVTINAVPTMGVKLDMPIILGGVNIEDSYEGDYTTRRALIYTLDFTSKVNFYPNIKGTGFGDYSDENADTLIRTAITHFHVVSTDEIGTSDKIILEDSPLTKSNFIVLEDGSKILSEDSNPLGTSSPKIKIVNEASTENINANETFTPKVISYFYEDSVEYNISDGKYN